MRRQMYALKIVVNIQDLYTPLHYAVLYRYTDIVRILIQHGAKTTTKDNDGKTPLDFIKTEDMRQMIEKETLLYAEKCLIKELVDRCQDRFVENLQLSKTFADINFIIY